jgi:hypothetical protein
VRIPDSAVEFFPEIIIKKSAIIETCQRIGCGADLEFSQVFILHQNRKTQLARGREHIHESGLERHFFSKGLRKLRLPRDCLVPQFEALSLGQVHLRNRMEKSLQELAATGAVQCVQRIC